MPEISNELEMATSSVHAHLKTLEDEGVVTKEGNEYNLGLLFFTYGEYVKSRKQEYTPAKEAVKRMWDISGESATFCVPENNRIYLLFGEGVPEDPVYKIGNRYPMHYTAVGKAIMADLPDERVAGIIETSGLPPQTENTITDEGYLYEELEIIRSRGYSLNKEELIPGLNSAAMTVSHPDGSVFGAISIGGPSYRVKGERLTTEIPEILQQTKRDLERELTRIYESS